MQIYLKFLLGTVPSAMRVSDIVTSAVLSVKKDDGGKFCTSEKLKMLNLAREGRSDDKFFFKQMDNSVMNSKL